MKKYIKYIPDLFIIIGIGILSYNILREPTEKGALPSLPSFISVDYHTEYKVLGILLIVIGIDILETEAKKMEPVEEKGPSIGFTM